MQLTLQQKLAKVQTEFKSKKSRFNSFGKYYFRSAEDILEAIKPFLLEHGITVTINEELINDNFVIKTTATIHDEKGLQLSTSAIVGVDLNQKGMQTSQQFGAASTYGKKYALGNLLLIDDTEDADASNTHGKSKPVRVDLTTAKPKPKITVEQFNKAKDYLKNGGKLEAIKTKYTLTSKQEETLATQYEER